MSKLIKIDTNPNLGVIATVQFDCGHSEKLFYGAAEFVHTDYYVKEMKKCSACRNWDIVNTILNTKIVKNVN